MLSEEQELDIVKKIVKTDLICDYFKSETTTKCCTFCDHFKCCDLCNKLKLITHDGINGVHITPSSKMEIIIVDDNVIEIDEIFITFENDNLIDELIITIKSGKYHNGDEIIGYDDLHQDFDRPRITLYSHNPINNLIVCQKICTENIYSYYGNQDGFNAGTISIEYDVNKYKKFKFSGQLKVESQEVLDDYWNLIVKVN